MEKIEISTKKLEIINQWISNCDTKSSFILTFYGVILSIIFTSTFGSEMVGSFSYTIATKFDGESFGNFVIFLTTILFFTTSIATFFQIYSTLKGRIDAKIYDQVGLKTSSNIFFVSIASKTFELFENESNNESEMSYLNDLNSQIYINANITSEKFKHYNLSLIWMFISLCLFIFYVIVK